jgi:hypothetical protein
MRPREVKPSVRWQQELVETDPTSMVPRELFRKVSRQKGKDSA